ncbi:MAG: MurT ligase domain-containing protein [Bifidobacteriaceae bacterium]|jgi:UDP-N-acetylmuramyl tripeptide synthase|nr:MurT ligase domain-containing protein [Bifidobacteriaceae bacterium]
MSPAAKQQTGQPATRLTWRSRLAIAAGQLAAAASRALGRGRGYVVGGQIMVRISPNIIAELARGKRTALISATNGKSTTTRFVAEALRTLGPVAHNSTGANMAPGVATALASNRTAKSAALEVDEAHLPAVLQATKADAVVLMNLSRDQLDRGAEVTRLAKRWRAMLEAADWDPVVVANADDPLVAWACQPARNVRWVGAGQWWRDDAVLCPACGHTLERDQTTWHCPACGLTRPQPTWQAERHAIVPPDGSRVPVQLRLPGRANVSNATMAAAAVDLWGIPPQVAVAAFAQVEDVDGRYIEAGVDGQRVRLLLGKNPASWTELIDIAGQDGHRLVVAINARGADGRDPSWLWDVPFERLAGQQVWAAGERRFDLAVRLDTAGLNVIGVAEDPLEAATRGASGGIVDVVANYTAFQAARARVTG